jgi:hypothetical protein
VGYVLEMSVAVAPSSGMAKSSVQTGACFILGWKMRFSLLDKAGLFKQSRVLTICKRLTPHISGAALGTG